MGTKILDKYTLLHFLSGIIARVVGLDIYFYTLLHILFEVLENSEKGMYIINNYFTFWPGGKPYKDFLINSLSDVTAGVIGWIITNYLFL